jgi:hypothetical protein
MDDWDSISAVKPLPQAQAKAPAEDWDSISAVKAKPIATDPAAQPAGTGVFSDTKGSVGAGTAAIRGVGDGITLGLQDEIIAGLDAAVQPLISIPENGSSADTWSQRYDENVANQRAQLKTGQEQNPIAAGIGGVVGAVAPALFSGGASLLGAGAKTSLAATSAKSAAIGAAQGGAYGFGSAEGDVVDRLPGAGEGALIGGVIGGAAPAAISALSGAARKVVPSRLLPSEGAQRAIDGPEPSPTPSDFTVDAAGTAQKAAPDAAPLADDVAAADLRGTAKSVVDASLATGKATDQTLADLAATIQPQQKTIDAAQRLGINGLTPAEISGNQTFRDIEGALAALPGNDIAAQRAKNLGELSQKADDFIAQFGGSTDKAGYSDAFKTSATQTIDALKGQADDLYSYIGKQIPRATQAPADNTIGYIQGKIADLGGAPLLNADERKALSILSPKVRTEPNPLIPGTIQTVTTNPTWAALDLVRKQVGQGYSRSGPFKDMQQGQLDALYGTLTRDQEALVNSVSPELGAIYKGAKSVVSQRKTLEDSLQSVLGTDLSGSIASSFGASVKQLSKGNFKNFDTIIKHIPEESRASAVVTALNDAFTAGTGQRELSATGFSKWYGDISRQGAARDRLFKYLPEDAVKRLDDIAEVAKGISEASKQTRRTGVSIGSLDDYLGEGGTISRIWGIAKPALVAEGLGTAAGFPGLGATIAVVAGMKKNAIPIHQKAADLLASPQLGNMLKSYAASGGQLKANVLAREKQLVRTQAYRKWEQALDSSARARIATVGPLVYLTEPAQKQAPVELPATVVNP